LVKVIVFVNANAGNRNARAAGDLKETISETFDALGVRCTVHDLPSKQAERAIKEAVAKEPDAIVVGGGDGTLSTAAAVLAGGNIPLGILPLGTLNHFAKDLGIPLDLKQAVAVISAGHRAAVDIGRVNDHVFINNSSLGLYARAVVERETHRDRLGMGKWLAMGLAVVNVFRRFSKLTVLIDSPHGVTKWTTPLVVVGNNHYCVSIPDLGKRARLDAGQLSLYIANTQTRWALAKLAARAFLGRLEEARDFEVVSSRAFKISARRNQIRGALDGEVLMLDVPLKYEISPQALQVLVPREAVQAQGTDNAATTR
jgi:YegS/Rv2252/BmrU family lipid kinase